jgi:hypothetical protein
MGDAADCKVKKKKSGKKQFTSYYYKHVRQEKNDF